MPSQDADHLEIKIGAEEINDADPAAGRALNDGDTIHFGRGLSSASILFQIMPENFGATQLVPQEQRAIGRPSGQPVHPLTATLFVKELTASLWAEIPKRAKMIGLTTASALVLAVVGTAFLIVLTLHRNTHETERLREQLDIQQSGREQDSLRMKKQQDEIDRLRELSDQMRLSTQKIVNQYSPGVCLIVGSYSFAERGSGRALRYEAADGANESPIDQNGNLLASVDGAGPAVQIDYTGTGFVIEEGVIATNKHVAQPWTTDSIAQMIMQQGGGFRPRLLKLYAFFPSVQTPFALKFVTASERYDIALCKFAQGNAALPILPLSSEDPRMTIGEPVAVLGYPTGVDGLLQRIDEGERREILKEHGLNAVDVATGLAARGLIRPLTTTGTVSDALPGRIVHSAQTTEGGSGSPIFDREGKVIAINSAILATIDGSQSFGGSNFGVPVTATYELLLTYRKTEAKAGESKQP
jgi:S1-C subfamily serine protease